MSPTQAFPPPGEAGRWFAALNFGRWCIGVGWWKGSRKVFFLPERNPQPYDCVYFNGLRIGPFYAAWAGESFDWE